MDSIQIHFIPSLESNYIYILKRENSPQCVVVDPGESQSVIDFCEQHQLNITQIWITHHHADHTKGIEALVEHYSCEVLGPKAERDKIPLINRALSELDLFHFGPHKVKVLETPGHTLGHIVYWLYQDNLLFCGDTLFSLGCGFLFEGSAKQMWNSLCKIRTLPSETLIYPAHEYTEANARFALSIDSENEDLKNKQQEILALREQHKPSLPSNLHTEIRCNPFLRADLPYWKEKLNLTEATPDEVFAKIRELKNHYK